VTGRPADWVLTHIVVNDATIAGDDPQAILDPVWYSASFYESVEVLEETLAPFSWPQRLAWAVLWTSAEICNGGLDQYFSNSTGMIWPEAIEGFEAMGRHDLAQIVLEATRKFRSPPARERALRWQGLDAMDRGALNELTDRYYDLEGDLFDDILAYIRNQPDAFYFEGDVYMPPPLASPGQQD
jgi:hypothetical protein